MYQEVDICTVCSNSVFTLKFNTEVNCTVVTCMNCGSQKKPKRVLAGPDGKLYSTGIKRKETIIKKPTYVKPDECINMWARKFDDIVKRMP